MPSPIMVLMLVAYTYQKTLSFRAFISGVDAAHLGTPSRTVKIVLIRHGESDFNTRAPNLEATGKSPREVRDLMLQETDSTNLVDAMLTPKGVEQAKEAGVRISKLHPNIEFLFASPFRRTVDTTMAFWSAYRPGTIPKLKLMPWASGSLEGLPVHSYDHLAKYPFVDRSRLAANPTFWFLDFMPENNRTHLRQRLVEASKKPEPYKEIARVVRSFDLTVETPSQVKERIEHCLQELREFIQATEKSGTTVQDYQILLVSHRSFLLQLIGGREILPDDTFGNFARFWENTDVMYYDLNL